MRAPPARQAAAFKTDRLVQALWKPIHGGLQDPDGKPAESVLVSDRGEAVYECKNGQCDGG